MTNVLPASRVAVAAVEAEEAQLQRGLKQVHQLVYKTQPEAHTQSQTQSQTPTQSQTESLEDGSNHDNVSCCCCWCCYLLQLMMHLFVLFVFAVVVLCSCNGTSVAAITTANFGNEVEI